MIFQDWADLVIERLAEATGIPIADIRCDDRIVDLFAKGGSTTEQGRAVCRCNHVAEVHAGGGGSCFEHECLCAEFLWASEDDPQPPVEWGKGECTSFEALVGDKNRLILRQRTELAIVKAELDRMTRLGAAGFSLQSHVRHFNEHARHSAALRASVGTGELLIQEWNNAADLINWPIAIAPPSCSCVTELGCVRGLVDGLREDVRDIEGRPMGIKTRKIRCSCGCHWYVRGEVPG